MKTNRKLIAAGAVALAAVAAIAMPSGHGYSPPEKDTLADVPVAVGVTASCQGYLPENPHPDVARENLWQYWHCQTNTGVAVWVEMTEDLSVKTVHNY